MVYVCLYSSRLLCSISLYFLPSNLSSVTENYFFQILTNILETDMKTNGCWQRSRRREGALFHFRGRAAAGHTFRRERVLEASRSSSRDQACVDLCEPQSHICANTFHLSFYRERVSWNFWLQMRKRLWIFGFWLGRWNEPYSSSFLKGRARGNCLHECLRSSDQRYYLGEKKQWRNLSSAISLDYSNNANSYSKGLNEQMILLDSLLPWLF